MRYYTALKKLKAAALCAGEGLDSHPETSHAANDLNVGAVAYLVPQRLPKRGSEQKKRSAIANPTASSE